MERKIKPKKCKSCGKTFTPFRPLQNVCSPKCAMTLAKQKETEKRERQDKIKFHDMKIRAKKNDYQKELQKAINMLARKIDAKFGYVRCIDCSREFGKQVDGAHFHTVGSHPEVRFNLHNIHSARSECNRIEAHHQRGYVQGLEDRYGPAYLGMVELLPQKYPDLKLSPQEIYDLLKLVRKLNREFDKYPLVDSVQARDWLNKQIGLYT